MTGKSQAAFIWAKAAYEADNTTRIGCACKSVYKRLIEQGVPEENLIKLWEHVEPEPTLWYDEFYEFTKHFDIHELVRPLK